MNQTTPKSATTAGLLGIFLGAFGAHSWYLGDKKNGIIHVSLTGGGIVLFILATILPFMATSLFTLFTLPAILSGLGGLVISGSGVWGFIEGIIILTKGDAGLAAHGIPVVAQPYAQPYAGQPYQGYTQPMPVQPQPYAQPAQQPYVQPVQPAPAQPATPATDNAQPTDNGGQVNAA